MGKGIINNSPIIFREPLITSVSCGLAGATELQGRADACGLILPLCVKGVVLEGAQNGACLKNFEACGGR